MRPAVTRTTLVEAALDVLDEEGIDGLTVRAIAARLGVKAPALYWHVASKQELLDEMGTEISRRIDARLAGLPLGADLATSLRAYAAALRAEYLAHRDGARTFSGTRLTDPALLRRHEPHLERWAEQGVALGTVSDAFEAVTAYVTGFVIEEQERAAPDRYDLAVRDSLVGPSHPLAVALGHHRAGPAAERFERQLDLFVAALSAGA